MARYHYYVVHRGRRPEIYHSWNECEANVHGYPNARYKGFITLEDATDSFHRFSDSETKVVGNVPRRSPNVQEALVMNRAECLLWSMIFVLCVFILMCGLVIYLLSLCPSDSIQAQFLHRAYGPVLAYAISAVSGLAVMYEYVRQTICALFISVCSYELDVNLDSVAF
ncbi:hypothetical protein AAC387_Pa02g2555 [Persea americana]